MPENHTVLLNFQSIGEPCNVSHWTSAGWLPTFLSTPEVFCYGMGLESDMKLELSWSFQIHIFSSWYHRCPLTSHTCSCWACAALASPSVDMLWTYQAWKCLQVVLSMYSTLTKHQSQNSCHIYFLHTIVESFEYGIFVHVPLALGGSWLGLTQMEQEFTLLLSESWQLNPVQRSCGCGSNSSWFKVPTSIVYTAW